MRKFFKSLAVLLALTLIVGVIPAAAADDISLQAEKILYIGGSKGQKADGTDCKVGAKKLVANMLKGGFDKTTMTVDLKSADKSIVKTTKTGRIKAVGIGTTTVTVTVFDADENQKFKQDLKVIVKKNAESVTVDGDLVDGGSYKVGQTLNVALPRQGVDTDKRDLVVAEADADKVEIKQGEKARTWTVKFLKSGEVNFIAKAYQSAAYPKETATAPIKVTVGNPTPTEVKVVASNAIELIFDEDIETLGIFSDKKVIPTDAIYHMIKDTKVSFSAVDSIKVKSNVLRITMYDNFASGVPYFVTINECDPIEFSLAGTSAKDVVEIVIATDTVYAGEECTLNIELLNASGINIAPNVGLEYVTTSITDYSKASINGTKLFITNVNDGVDVKADYKYFDVNDNYKEISATKTKKIYAVARAAHQVTGKVYTIEKNFDTSKIGKNYTGKTYFALGDDGYIFSCYLIAKDPADGSDKSILVNNSNTFGGKIITATIKEEKVAMITSNIGGKYRIVANEEGVTNVFIGYFDTNNNNKWETIDVCPIEIKQARYPASLEVTPNKTNLNLDDSTDSISYKVKVKDQYGDLYVKEAANYTFTQNPQSSNNYGLCKIADGSTTNTNDEATGEATITIVGGNIKPATDSNNATKTSGSVNGTIKLKNSNSKANPANINFSWAKKGTEASSLQFTNIKDATLDTALTEYSSIKVARLQIMGKKDGYNTGVKALVPYVDKNGTNFGKIITNEADVPKVGAISGAALVLAIRKDGTIINPADSAYAPFIKNDGLNIDPVVLNASGAAIKMPKGVYTFTLYEVKDGKIQPNQVVTVTVNDSQQAATFKQVAEKTSTPTAPTDAIELYFGNTKLTDITSWVCTPSSETVYVKSAKANLTIKELKVNDGVVGTNVPYDMTINVGKLLKK